jgi:hypothetical protein
MASKQAVFNVERQARETAETPCKDYSEQSPCVLSLIPMLAWQAASQVKRIGGAFFEGVTAYESLRTAGYRHQIVD